MFFSPPGQTSFPGITFLLFTVTHKLPKKTLSLQGSQATEWQAHQPTASEETPWKSLSKLIIPPSDWRAWSLAWSTTSAWSPPRASWKVHPCPLLLNQVGTRDKWSNFYLASNTQLRLQKGLEQKSQCVERKRRTDLLLRKRQSGANYEFWPAAFVVISPSLSLKQYICRHVGVFPIIHTSWTPVTSQTHYYPLR